MSEILDLHNDLLENGYANVPIDLTKSDLENSMDDYMAFLELDDKYHEATVYFNTDRGDGDFGQFTRVAGRLGLRGAIQDNKDIFHFGAQTRQIVESRISGPMPKDMSNFLNSAEEIFWTSQRTKRQTLEELDYKETGLCSVMSPEVGRINDVLRFIAYHLNVGSLAKSHFDRSTFTFAIGESHEGLRLTGGQNGLKIDCNQDYMDKLESKLKPVNHQEGKAKFMLGAGWNRLPQYLREGNPNLPLGWHDVVESDITVSEKIMRWAIVNFCNPFVEFDQYIVPSPPETRPYKQLGRIV